MKMNDETQWDPSKHRRPQRRNRREPLNIHTETVRRFLRHHLRVGSKQAARLAHGLCPNEMEELVQAVRRLMVPVAVCIQNSTIPKDEQFWSEGALTPPSSGGLQSSSSLPAEFNNLFQKEPPSMNMLPSLSRQLLRSQTRGSEGPLEVDMLAVDEQTSLRAGHADVETTGEVPSTVAIDGSTHAAATGFFEDQPAGFEDLVALVQSTTAKAINDALYRDALDRVQPARSTTVNVAALARARAAREAAEQRAAEQRAASEIASEHGITLDNWEQRSSQRSRDHGHNEAAEIMAKQRLLPSPRQQAYSQQKQALSTSGWATSPPRKCAAGSAAATSADPSEASGTPVSSPYLSSSPDHKQAENSAIISINLLATNGGAVAAAPWQAVPQPRPWRSLTVTYLSTVQLQCVLRHRGCRLPPETQPLEFYQQSAAELGLRTVSPDALLAALLFCGYRVEDVVEPALSPSESSANLPSPSESSASLVQSLSVVSASSGDASVAALAVDLLGWQRAVPQERSRMRPRQRACALKLAADARVLWALLVLLLLTLLLPLLLGWGGSGRELAVVAPPPSALRPHRVTEAVAFAHAATRPPQRAMSSLGIVCDLRQLACGAICGVACAGARVHQLRVHQLRVHQLRVHQLQRSLREPARMLLSHVHELLRRVRNLIGRARWDWQRRLAKRRVKLLIRSEI